MEDNLTSKIKLKKTIEYIGPFGTGKTTSLENYFNDSATAIPIWFNAFNFDFSDSPKTTFINEMIMNIYKTLGGKTNKEKAINAMKLVQRLVKGTVASTFESKGIALSEADDAAWRKVVENYETESKKIEKLKMLLNEMASATEKDVVIIIDDLDRARPDFALEIIEIAKHIFDVPNITIIFVYDRKAMDSIAAKKYGEREGERYLDKYIYETYVHDDAAPFEGLDNHYFMIGFKSILNPSARQLSIFDKKYGLKYNAVTGGVDHIFNSDTWFVVKGIMTAIRISNPELLKLITNQEGAKVFKHQQDLYKEVLKAQKQIQKNINPALVQTYDEFLNSIKDGINNNIKVIRLAKFVNNMPLKTELD